MAKGKKYTTDIFIEKAIEKHGDLYDYSLVDYKNSITNVEIICKEHGKFSQRPSSHLSGAGCPLCSGNKKMTTYDFIKKAREKHGDRYSYTKVNYINNNVKVIITCPIHGDFEQDPSSHTSTGRGCPECGGSKRLTTEQFIERAREVHGYEYNYDKVDYINSNSNVIITCPIHGDFEQNMINHVHNKKGCPKCNGGVPITKEDFIKTSINIHGDKYDYSLVKYVNSNEKVEIICPLHGSFYKRPNHHISQKSGCPKCSLSKGEEAIRVYLEKNKIKYTAQKKFKKCKNKRPLPFDFYLPKHNTCIEYDGIQHYDENNKYYDDNIPINDKIKTEFCKNNNIKLIRIAYWDFDNIKEILDEKIRKEGYYV